MTSANSFNHSLRLTPSNSPFFRSPTARSPIKSPRHDEPGLRLQKVIGTTTASSHAFASLPSAGKFAFTAGSAAVLATVNDDLDVVQHFFRANPSSGPRDGSNGWPTTPTQADPRSRLKEQTQATSPSNSIGREWSESNRSLTAKDRVKAATSVDISPNGKWLAVGETGYKPRVLLFSAKDGSSETPITTLAEHTFGVHALSFSPDSRFLASLGTVNDGYLYVWSVDDRTGGMTLFASNKCTTTIHAMSWMGRSVLTVGLRYAKVWRPEEDTALEGRENIRSSILVTPRPKIDSRPSDYGNSISSPRHRVLVGKNILLGDLLDVTFVSIVVLSNSTAILSAESGEICLLDDTDRTQSIKLAANAGMSITSARLDDAGVYHAFGADDNAVSFSIEELQKGAFEKSGRRNSGSLTKLSAVGAHTVAVAAVGTALVEISSDRIISLAKTDDQQRQRRRLPAHEDAVLGVRNFTSTVLPEAAFYTFSGNGTVHFWTAHGVSVAEAMNVPVETSPEMWGMANGLTAMTALLDGTFMASGDKYGTVALLGVATRRIVHQVRAHAAEILDLITFEREGAHFLASASRDRTVQLFLVKDRTLELLQTMDEHAGAVTSLLLAQHGTQLLSCSADRTVVVRDSVFRDPQDSATLAFAMLRAITLKSAPVSMCLASEPNSILVSTLDRCIAKYSTSSGQAGFSFKCSDNEGGEAVVISKVIYAPSLNGNPTIAGVSSGDKSFRLYTEYGNLIARDWGHTEGITDMAIVQCRDGASSFVTVAADTTIFLWSSMVATKLTGPQPNSATEGQNSPVSTPLGPPLRKVISHSNIARLRRERSVDGGNFESPLANATPSRPSSPPKMRKKTSRASLAQTPRLEPVSRPSYDSSRRKTFNRSPSPPSPRNTHTKDVKKRQSLGANLRSKSSESIRPSSAVTSNSSTGFGSLTGSTESVCRTLRAYRKKLTTTAASESIPPDSLRELEKELKLTAKVVGERSHRSNIDEATLAKLLDQASLKFAGLVDEQIKARVERELGNRTHEDAPPSPPPPVPPLPTTFNKTLGSMAEVEETKTPEKIERLHTAPGARDTTRSASSRGR
ncbi:unnamed protein product [Zymoseptoria tritici ST99CH_3D1]|uniref:Uncharacterized protein n=1 Tax=Zymoseptoria tritici ST99CH_1E4 TaxID=1276532 RepID=A0A2H1FMM2_ZYMTR|nr:unnamed protein product [Zymoseptoria tritici ST99CH_1E4]SMR44725.1 unnamed protein product [Zymoseptoria tritici ST99CH_3D1]